MTLDEAFQGSICVYINYANKETTFPLGPGTGYIDLTTTLHEHKSKASSIRIVKIIPSEKAKKWLNDNYLQEYPLP